MKKGTRNNIILWSTISFVMLLLFGLPFLQTNISDEISSTETPSIATRPIETTTRIPDNTIIKPKKAQPIKPSNIKELEKLHQWVQNSLASGAVHSVNVEYNEVRMDPIPWSLVPIESKQIIIQCFSRYFDLKGSTGRVTIRSKYSDEKLASYSVWSGIKIYK